MLFAVDDRIVIDATRRGNSARFIITPASPTARRSRKRAAFYRGEEEDRAGEELSYDYNLVLDERHTPAVKRAHACSCGAGDAAARFSAASADASGHAKTRESNADRSRTTERVYSNYADVYDRLFGRVFQASRETVVRNLKFSPGERVLEVARDGPVPAALSAQCDLTAIDLSEAMLGKAAQRVKNQGLTNVRLLRMDAGEMEFADTASTPS